MQHWSLLNQLGLDTVAFSSSGTITATNIFTSPLILVNGLLFDSSALSRLGGFEDAVFTLVLEQTACLQQEVMHQRFTDSESSVETLFARAGLLIPRYNRHLLGQAAGGAATITHIGSHGAAEGDIDPFQSEARMAGVVSSTGFLDLGHQPGSALDMS
ncbi:unnamed protein product [Protopolystoma xenopodis]|uniref:Uncharacterized protein n=1 Tax=Protopolystoma xenopodis TaxID=117903 RepID=A0A3S5BNV9_9PLAT|nr:unnamed protein product [Protopolystoma xenopodis]